MSLSRRQLLKLIALGVAGQTLDIDRLLWVPNQKKIFIPYPAQEKFYSLTEIIAIEYEKILPQMKVLFEHEDAFYSRIKR